MLASLSIRDIVLIDRLDLSFGPGLTVLTGETGGGKSILLDSLALALGRRAEGGLVRPGATKGSVTAEFSLPPSHRVFALLADQDIGDGEDEPGRLILRRVLNEDGRSRAFVQDQAVSIGLLSRIGEALVEIHGQFQTVGLLDPGTHRAALDRHGGLEQQVDAVADSWAARRAAHAERDRIAEEVEASRRDEAFLSHAVAELDELAPEEGEQEALEARRSALMNRERLLEGLNAAHGDLGDRAEPGIGAARRTLERLVEHAPSLGPLLDRLSGLDADLQDVVAELRRIAVDLDGEEESLDGIEERLFALRALARKHQTEVDALVDLRHRLAERLSLIEHGETRLQEAIARFQAADRAWHDAARSLSDKRRAAAAKLDRGVLAELAPLKLDRARFVTSVEALPIERAGAQGIDSVRFEVATNPGAAPGPIGKIASGGELARFMLALRVVLAGSGEAETLVFDEVDAGIGGAVAAAVGERLARLGEALQVLVVTHSPQVAARGRAHLTVGKQTRGNSAVTRVATLDEAARRDEIARMLSGASITDEARAAAASLLAAR